VGGAPQGNTNLLSTKPVPAGAPVVAVHDGLLVETRTRLKRPREIAGIKPLPEQPVASARLIARWPDGRVQPLVWLYKFDPKFAHVFTFREPLTLPAGTVVESSAPLRYRLETLRAP